MTTRYRNLLFVAAGAIALGGGGFAVAADSLKDKLQERVREEVRSDPPKNQAPKDSGSRSAPARAESSRSDAVRGRLAREDNARPSRPDPRPSSRSAPQPAPAAAPPAAQNNPAPVAGGSPRNGGSRDTRGTSRGSEREAVRDALVRNFPSADERRDGRGNDRGNDRDRDYDRGGRDHDRDYRRPRVVRTLPSGYRDYWWNGDRYYFHHGSWYRPYGSTFITVGVPYGLFVGTLPGYYSTFWYGGTRYFFADETYYVYDSGRRGYVVSRSPYGDDEDEYADEADEDLFIYPAEGQSEQQLADDRYECHRWAVSESDYNPLDDAYDPRLRSDYLRAMTACLTGRGYSVK